MDFSEDEEVLLENSPLYDYLKDTCPQDEFLSSQTTSTHEQDENIDDDEAESTSVKDTNDHEGSFRWLTQIKENQQQITKSMAEEYLPHYMSVLVSSPSMFAEDVQVLMMYCNTAMSGEGGRESHHKSAKGTGTTFSQVLSSFGLFATLIGLCIGGYRGVVSDTEITPFQFLTWCALLILCLSNTILYGSAWWIRRVVGRAHMDNVKLLETLVEEEDRYDSLLKRCIRFVQEVEVISRGFTLASPITPVAQQEGLYNIIAEQQCPLLREVCFQTCKQQIFAFKQATISLLQQTRLQSEVDGTTSYLAKMDLDKIIPTVSTKANDVDDLEPITTTTRSLAVLKVMYDLYIELKSEFLRRLTLCICPDAIQNGEKLDSHSLQRWNNILSRLCEPNYKTLSKLKHSYDWHKERPTSRRRDESKDGYNPLQAKWSPANHLTTAVHSLKLQLDFALNGAITAEEHLASLSDSVHNQDQMEKSYKILETLLEGANEKLQSSYSCLQQASMALSKLQGKAVQKQPETKKVESDSEASPSGELPMTTLVLPVAPEDMDFEDTVFEADMTKEENNAREQDFDSDWFMEEKARKQQEAQETKYLLQELHTVLGQRSKERELRQLARKGQASNKQSVPGETSAAANDPAQNMDIEVEGSRTQNSSDIGGDSLEIGVEDIKNPGAGDARYSIKSNNMKEQVSRTSDEGDGKDIDEQTTPVLPPQPQQRLGLPRPAAGLPFMTSVAAQAVMKSRLQGGLAEETFGQGDSSSDDEQG